MEESIGGLRTVGKTRVIGRGKDTTSEEKNGKESDG